MQELPSVELLNEFPAAALFALFGALSIQPVKGVR